MSKKSTFLLGERLKFARSQAGLSQAQIAKLMSLHRPTISQIEAGKRKVSSEEILRFADAYDVSTVWLLEERTEIEDSAIQFAARELAKLKSQDLDTILSLLKTLRAKR